MSFAFFAAPVVLFALAMAVLLPVMRRLLRFGHGAEPMTPEWLETFSPSDYRAMDHLLDEDDFEFLVRQPGFEPSIAQKLRRDRIRIFRQYLHQLVDDFNRLHSYCLSALAAGDKDQSELLTRLLWLRVRFGATVIRVELSLCLCYFGFRPSRIKDTIARLDEMNLLTRGLTAA